MDGYDFEKLTREIVVSRFGDLAEKAPEAAAEVARKTLVTTLTDKAARQDPRLTVTAVCRGLLGGLLFINQDLPAAAVRVLRVLGDVAVDVHLSPEDLMTWAMEGFAAVAVVAGPEAEHGIETAIEQQLMGAGSVFTAACAAARAQKGAAS